MTYSRVPNRRAGLLIYFSFFCRPDLSLFGPTLLFFSGVIWQPVLSFKSDRPTEAIKRVNVDYLTCLLWTLHLFSVYMAFSQYSHTAWRKPIFIENCCFCKKIKPKIICKPDIIFRLAEHLVTLTLHMFLPLYHLEEMWHPDHIFCYTLLFGTWEYVSVISYVSIMTLGVH